LEECVKLLLPLAARATPPSGTRRLLGLALGRLGQLDEAMRVLSAAVAEDPGDALLRASLLSAEILAGRLPEPPVALVEGPLSELAGAAAWLQGQTLLREGRPAVAATNFQQASLLLGSHVPGSITAERASAAFVGEAVSRLAAGQLQAAQQCYLRLPGRERLPTEAAQFARQLYEVAGALSEIEPADRPEALQPLVELVSAARLRLRFFDQERPVEIWWDHLP
jgi:tetratricopeptide (TPR) repeat protein